MNGEQIVARLRTIKPEFFQNEDLADLPISDRLLFIGLWTLADRRGILEDRPKRIKASLFPYDDFDVEIALQRLAEKGFLRRYASNGVSCIYITKFTKHQSPHQNEKESDLPVPDDYQNVLVLAPDENENTPSLVGSGVLGSGIQGVESGGKGRKRTLKSQLPKNWSPSESDVRYAKEDHHLTDKDITHEAASFRDHWHSKAEVRADWSATWRNWLRNSKRFAATRPPPTNGRYIHQRDNPGTDWSEDPTGGWGELAKGGPHASRH